MLKKLLILGVILIMCLGFFTGCDEDIEEDIATDSVSVMIKAEYREKFMAEEFSAEDFEWDNIDKVFYQKWYEKAEKGWMIISLKKHGKKQAEDAVSHFNTLDFVDIAETIGKIKITPIIKNYKKEEKKL